MIKLQRLRWAAAGIALGVAVATASAAPAQSPDELNVAIILSAGIENGWDGSLIESFERVKAEAPHDLEISWRYSDPLWGDAAGEAMRVARQSG